jgi:hypothetical protein
MDRTEGIKALEDVIKKIKQGIEQYRGIFKIKIGPRVTTDADDIELTVTIDLIR